MPAPSPGFDGDGFDGDGFDGEGFDGDGSDGEGFDGEGVDGEGVDGDGIDGDGDPLFLGLVGELPLQPVKTTSERTISRAISFFMMLLPLVIRWSPATMAGSSLYQDQ